MPWRFVPRTNAGLLALHFLTFAVMSIYLQWWSKLMRHEARPSRRTVEFLFHHFNRRRMFRELIDAYHYVKEHGLFVNLSGQVDVSTPHFLDSRGFHSGEDQQFGRTEPLTLVSDWLYMLLNACLKEK